MMVRIREGNGMVRFWRPELVRTERRGPGTAMSIALHVGLIALAVILTNPPEGLRSLYDLANRVIYIAPPPPRIGNAEGSPELLKFESTAPVGLGAGFERVEGPGPSRKSEQLAMTPTAGDQGIDLMASTGARRILGVDSVFTIIDVDSAVRTDPSSVAPEYPAALMKLGIEGLVKVRYIVDSTGLADPATLQVVKSTRVEFAVAVREALPNMRFVPAKMGAQRVRQLVEQTFNFKIARPDTTVARAR